MDTASAMREAMAAHKAGRFAEAEAGYRDVLAARPADPKAFYYLGLLQFHRGDTPAAIELMRRCLRFAPNHPHAWNALGGMLIAAGSRSEATQAYRRVTETAPALGEGWYNLGICLRDEGDIDSAIACLHASIERQPEFEKSYDALGTMLYQLGRISESAQVYAAWSRHSPQNPIARHMAAATSGQQVPARAADDFVRTLFDESAGTFDADIDRLEYRAPGIVSAALAERAGITRFARVLDAGCGTGLCGPLLRERSETLCGVDLSPQMIERARARGCYDELAVSELSEYLRAHAGELDAIVSADTLVYFGDLEEPLAAAFQALRTPGVLIATLEASPAGTGADFALEAHGRYSHAEGYVQRAVRRAGLTLQALTHEVFRRERDADVPGLLLVAGKGVAQGTVEVSLGSSGIRRASPTEGSRSIATARA